MNVPLDKLYHYLADSVNHDLVIYRWLPHGSRKLEDLTQLTDKPTNVHPLMLCHDQEPINPDLWSAQDIYYAIQQKGHVILHDNNYSSHKAITDYYASLGIRGMLPCRNQFDKCLLLHSEQLSDQVTELASDVFIPVYYWSHAVIALDWFRYAQHDPMLKYSNFKKDFLIYNRAWSGTREYRLYFAQQIIAHQLDSASSINFAEFDNHVHYTNHSFVNNDLQISNFDLHKLLPSNTAKSDSSADYVAQDYVDHAIDVVLETLFDENRWHLTEKILRPIACGKPFILAATPGSLKYLQSYGFETFGSLIDESYDLILDSRTRLDHIIEEMQRIAALSHDDKQALYTKLHKIAQRNKHRFFNELFDQVMNEYRANLDHAMILMNQHQTGLHISQIQSMR
jgi:hypothetical protein